MRGDKSYLLAGSAGKIFDARGDLVKVNLGFKNVVLTFARATRPTDKPNSVKIVARSSDEQIPDEHFRAMVLEAKKLLWPSKLKGAG